MGLFDFFSSKEEDPYKDLKVLAKDVNEFISRVEGLSEKLERNLEQLNEKSFDHLNSKIKDVEIAHEKKSKLLNEINNLLEKLNTTPIEDQEYKSGVDILNKNIGALNVVSEIELQDANSYLKAKNKFFENFTEANDSLSEVKENLPDLLSLIEGLKKRVAEIQ